MIYLDNAATTRPFKSVTEKAGRYYTELYFNPSALYSPAAGVASEIDNAREYINSALGGGGSVCFTSCATESNTWVFGSGVKNKKGNIVVSMGEHASVYENAVALSGKGYDVRFVKLLPDGRIDPADFKSKVDTNTTLISVIHCSNETGAINDLKNLAAVGKKIAPNALFHSDGVQAFGKIPVRCAEFGVDLYSISAHKIGGFKGIGGLWIKNGVHLNPLMCGGGQERGLRSGTENVAGIIGFAEAVKQFLQTDVCKIAAMRKSMISALTELKDVSINGCEDGSPYILSVSIGGIRAEILQRMLCDRRIIIGLGSACSARHRKNRVLTAIGRDMSRIDGSIRISFGPDNIDDDMASAESAITECVKSFRGF